MKRRFYLLIIIPSLLFSCQSKTVNGNLAEVDSLVVAELFDSAYYMVTSKITPSSVPFEDYAHFSLLRVQTAYLVNKPLASSDSILDDVISYYEGHLNHEKLADAYYYKAIGAYKSHNIPQSIILYKESEQHAILSANIRQQYKVAEGISFVNGRCAKYDLQLDYAKKSLELAKVVNNKKWIAYSLYRVGVSFSKLGNEDSVLYYFGKIEPYLPFVGNKDLPVLLSSLGYYLKDDHPKEARHYLLESLKYQEFTATYSHLAEISFKEGLPDEANRLWKKALTVRDATPKDNIIRNLIGYDIECGKTDSICERINEIIAIRDSIDAKLKNDTIKDLQTRFDHEVAMREKDQIVIRWQWVAIILVVLLLIGTVYYLVRKYQVRIRLQRSQMQINDYMEQIRALQSDKGDRTNEIERLNKQIERIMEEKSPRLAQGRMLYDMVVANKKMSRWKKDDVKMFIEYYTATNYRVVNRLRSIPRKEELTPHHLLYLILLEMGKTDQEIRLILSISKETLRTLRFRTKPLDEIESEKSDQTL